MSWAAHNPELYEECERKAVASMLANDLRMEGFEQFDRDTLENIVYVLQDVRRSAFDRLVERAPVGEEISSQLTRCI